jgi:hypothetical protein
MKTSTWTLLLSVICLMSGCTQYWYQPGVTLDQAKQDHHECFRGLLLQQQPATSMTSSQLQEMNACMAQKGYRLVDAGQLPKSADRIGPAQSPHWKLHGVAGAPRDKTYPLFDY